MEYKMKNATKLLSLILFVCMFAGMLVSCKDEKYEAYDRTGEPYDYYLPDYVDVCEYTGIEIPEVSYAPSKTDIENRKKQLAGYYCDRTQDPDRPCQLYDYVDIVTTCKFTDTGEIYQLLNFELSEEGVGQTFLLGTNNFWIPAIDDAVVGMRQGETKTVTFNIPDPYFKDFLNSGREVEMEIYLNYIDEVDYTGVDDQFYYDHYGYYGETLENSIIEDLRKKNNESIIGYKVAIAWNYICDNSKLKKVPEKEYQEIYDSQLNSARSAAESKELTLLEYVNEQGYKTLEDYYDYLKDYAENTCYEEMILYYIIRCENLKYDDAFYESTVLSMTEKYEITNFTDAEDFLIYYMGAENLNESVLMQYTQNWIVEKGVIRKDINQFFSDELNK